MNRNVISPAAADAITHSTARGADLKATTVPPAAAQLSSGSGAVRERGL
jgi:hypothetical protein